MTGPVLHQATCVAVGARALMLEGPPGSGKTTLALKLIDRGAILIGDDGVALSLLSEQVLASPPAPIKGLIEVRNVGLVAMPTTAAPLALVLRLARDAPRFVEQSEQGLVLGRMVPRLWFDPSIPAAAIRAELALERYGL
ncbi:MAG: serine kinase [Erythrobacter sp. 34-65-8]|nr:MAG: serine kinase [Erythrobacter sp. 34-65-8]